MKRFINKKRLVAAGISVALVAGGAGAAFAYFTASGSGNGTAATGQTNESNSNANGWTVSVTSDTSDALFPGTAAGSGGEASLPFSIENNTPGQLGLGNVDIEVAQDSNGYVLSNPSDSTSGVTGCLASWYDLDGTGTPSDANATYASAGLIYGTTHVNPHTTLVDVASGDSVTGTATLTLVDSTTASQDDCQGVTPSIVVSAS